MANNANRGYDVEVCYDIDKQLFNCLLCTNVIVQATRVCDHHVFCKRCIVAYAEKERREILDCPARCGQTFNKNQLQLVGSLDKVIQEIPCKCSGCNWRGELLDLIQNHETICEEKKIICNLCKFFVKRKNMQIHLENECPKRLVQCQYCLKGVTFEIQDSHEDACGNRIGDCYFKKFGFTFQNSLKNVFQHEHQSRHHLKLIGDFLNMKMEDSFSSIKSENNHLKMVLAKIKSEEISKLNKENKEIKDDNHRLLQNFNTLFYKVNELTKDHESTKNNVKDMKETQKTIGRRSLENSNQLNKVENQLKMEIDERSSDKKMFNAEICQLRSSQQSLEEEFREEISQLNEENEILKKECKELFNHNEKLENQMKQFSEEKQQIETEIKNIKDLQKSSKESIDEEFKKLTVKNTELEAEFNAISNDMKKFHNELNDISNEKQLMKQEIREMKTTNKSFSESINERISLLNKENTEFKKIQDQILHEATMLESRVLEISENSESIKENVSQIENWKNCFEETINREIELVKDNNKKFESVANNLLKHTSKMKVDLNTIAVKNDLLKTEMKEVLDSLKARQLSLNESFVEHQKQNENFEITIAKISEQLETLKNETSQLLREENFVKNEIESIKSFNKILESDINKENVTLKQEICNIKDDYNSSTIDIEELQDKIIEQEKIFQNKLKEITGFLNENIEKEIQVVKDEHIKYCDNEIKTLKVENCKFKEEHNKFSNDINLLKSKIDEMAAETESKKKSGKK